MVRNFQKSDYNNYDTMVCELDDIAEREAGGSMNDAEKEVFSCDLRVARKWVEQCNVHKK